MAQSILNYSTKIAVTKTMAEIEHILVSHGASEISRKYEDGYLCAVTFTISAPHIGTHRYVLPANVDGVQDQLEKSFRAGYKASSREQAGRTAFRILKDWVEAQMAIIDAGMGTLEQVMLPYQLLPSGESIYQQWLTYRGDVLLLPASAEEGR